MTATQGPETAASAARRRRATLALLAVTVIWGSTFVWMKQSLEAAERVWGHRGGAAAVCLYTGLRFALAAVVLAALVPGSRRGLTAPVWRGALLLGGLLLAGFLFQMLGLEDVTPAVSAFVTSLYVVFSALLVAALARRRPRATLVAGALLATFGAGFINGPPHLTFGVGEWLTVACALIFAVHILATDRLTKILPPLPVSLASFAVVGFGSLAALPALLGRQGGPSWRDVARLAGDSGFVVPLLLASVLATVVALTMMNVYQRELDPVRAAILYAVEPVWASIIAVALGYGTVGGWLLVGGSALLAGNIVAELGERRTA